MSTKIKRAPVNHFIAHKQVDGVEQIRIMHGNKIVARYEGVHAVVVARYHLAVIWNEAVPYETLAPIVGAKFVEVLKAWIKEPGYMDGDYQGLTPDQGWEKMCADNAANGPGRNTCASHDWCDANMAMDEAIRSFGLDPLPPDRDGGMSQAMTDLWNAAWESAQPALDGRTK